MRSSIALAAIAHGCSSQPAPSARPAEEAPRATPVRAGDAAATAAAPFVRLDASVIDKARLEHDAVLARHQPRGEMVGQMQQVGAFACKLVTAFGAPEPLWLNGHDARALGQVLRHAATGMLIAPHLGAGNRGYAGGAIIGPDGSIQIERDWRFFPPGFEAVASELDDLLDATAPADCTLVYSGGLHVNETGVRDGEPYFRHMEWNEQLAYRLAELVENDERGGTDRAKRGETLCGLAMFAWRESGKAPGFSRRDELQRRLHRCIDTELAEIETEIAKDWFDHDAIPESFDALAADAKLLARDPALDGRIARARARIRVMVKKLKDD